MITRNRWRGVRRRRARAQPREKLAERAGAELVEPGNASGGSGGALGVGMDSDGVWADVGGTGRLEALLTPLRARILLDLAEPRSMTVLAQRYFIVPSAATYQVGRLAAAGLVERTRTGSFTVIRRSALGDRLVALFADVGPDGIRVPTR